MTHRDKPEISFYQKTGELFYAIAASDKIVRKIEYNELKRLVKEAWLLNDTAKDDYNSDAVYQMEIVFDWFDYERMDAESCFEQFKEYFLEYPNQFTPQRKQLILTTAHLIADAFSGKNKSELIMLSKLQLLFKK